jgi:serine/threonine protein kinase
MAQAPSSAFFHIFPPFAQASKFIGTLQYMAPEVVIARGDDFDASDASQVERSGHWGGLGGLGVA